MILIGSTLLHLRCIRSMRCACDIKYKNHTFPYCLILSQRLYRMIVRGGRRRVLLHLHENLQNLTIYVTFATSSSVLCFLLQSGMMIMRTLTMDLLWDTLFEPFVCDSQTESALILHTFPIPWCIFTCITVESKYDGLIIANIFLHFFSYTEGSRNF